MQRTNKTAADRKPTHDYLLNGKPATLADVAAAWRVPQEHVAAVMAQPANPAGAAKNAIALRRILAEHGCTAPEPGSGVGSIGLWLAPAGDADAAPVTGTVPESPAATDATAPAGMCSAADIAVYLGRTDRKGKQAINTALARLRNNDTLKRGLDWTTTAKMEKTLEPERGVPSIFYKLASVLPHLTRFDRRPHG
jgi:hypothetical protein